jgi:hypothetical protein
MAGGCLERIETIRVRDDGQVSLESRFKGAADAFKKPYDALPRPGAGWTIRWESGPGEPTDREPAGKSDRQMIATLETTLSAGFPETYASDPADPAYASSLRFPTLVRLEPRGDGLYYHFKRVYLARAHQRFNWPRAELEKDDAVKDLLGKKPEQMTADERSRLVDAFAKMETHRQLELIAAATERMSDFWPQDFGLRLRAAAARYGEEPMRGPMRSVLAFPPGPERDIRLGEVMREVLAGFVPALQAEMNALGLGEVDQRMFLEALAAERDLLSATDNLADEAWTVRVELPGELVGHNGASAAGGVVTWEFNGTALLDRDVVLLATSRVPLRGR